MATCLPGRHCPEHLRDLIRRKAGDHVCEIAGCQHSFLWSQGQTMIEACHEDGGSILLRAYVVIGPQRTRELETDVLLFSAGLPFGELEVDDDGDVSYVHRVPCCCGTGALDGVLASFCGQAERLGRLLCERLGGCSSLTAVRFQVENALRWASAQDENALN